MLPRQSLHRDGFIGSVWLRGWEIRVSYNAREVLRSGGHYSLGSFPEKRRGFSCLTHVADFSGLVGLNCQYFPPITQGNLRVQVHNTTESPLCHWIDKKSCLLRTYRKISWNPPSPAAANLWGLSQKFSRRISAFLTRYSLSHLAVLDLVNPTS